MDRIKARIQTKQNFYVHNDLSNAAFHFKNGIEDRLKRDDRAGIAFEYLACAVMIALTFEAKINFLGAKLISNWQERQPFNDKVDQVFAHLGIKKDATQRPYSSIEQMKRFRDSVAHGKPTIVEHDETVVMTQDS